MKQKLGFLLAVMLAAFIGACGTSSTDATASGPTQAQFDALQAQVTSLQATVTAQQAVISKISGLYLVAGSGSTASLHTQSYNGSGNTELTTKATGTCPGPETPGGYPDNSDPRVTNLMSLHSCSGYVLVRNQAASGEDSNIQELPGVIQVAFDAADCTGNGYAQGISTDVRVHGMVFTMNPTAPMSVSDFSNPAYYYYVPAGEAQSSFNEVSFYKNGACQNAGSVQTNYGYAIAPNDSTVTGEDSAPIAGPYVASQL